jgi:peptide deformylase
MLFSLLYYDHPLLRKKSLMIESIDDELKSLAQGMVDSMIHYNGVGLAAPQIGKLIRLIVIRDEFVGEDGEFCLGSPEVLINPVLRAPSKTEEKRPEGCLSIPGIHAEVMRPLSICVKYQTLDGRTVEEEAKGFRARVIMHENDHLNGVLYIDRVDSNERKIIDPRLKALKDKTRVNDS